MLQNSKNIVLNNSMSKLKKSIKEIFNELYVKNGIVVKIDFKITNNYDYDCSNINNINNNDINVNNDDNKNIFFKFSKSIDVVENISIDKENDIININDANTNNDFDSDKTEIQSTNSSLALSFYLIDVDDYYLHGYHEYSEYHENWQSI